VSELLELAARIAREAGALQRARFREPREIGTKSSPTDLVTDVDHACDALIGQRIREARPQDGVLSEELGERAGASDVRWVVDPLDGTTNYAHGFPHFAVSIGVEQRGERVAGVVYDPLRDELYAAARGAGAWRGEERLRVSHTPALAQALLATGFAPHPTDVARNLPYFGRLLGRSRAIRRAGSAALDLAYVACGRFDGFWELSLGAWDMCAGSLLVEEAGGAVSDLEGNRAQPRAPIVASNGRIHAELLRALRA
jgi:myo-inositol-1(or 4)-monophosphatase